MKAECRRKLGQHAGKGPSTPIPDRLKRWELCLESHTQTMFGRGLHSSRLHEPEDARTPGRAFLSEKSGKRRFPKPIDNVGFPGGIYDEGYIVYESHVG